MKLNSISNDVFEAKEVAELAVNAGNMSISRKDLVATGRLVACEYIGAKLNMRPGTDKYVSRLSGMSYNELAKKHSDKLFMFCASMANKAVGKEAPASIEEAKSDLSYAKDRTFLATLAAITKDVLTPIIFRVYDDISAGGLMQWESVPFGGTKEIEVRSNDVFLFEDSSWGSGRSASYNYLYSKTITLNPKMFACQAKIKWYQSIVNGDAGYYYNAIMNGMWNKIYAIFISNLLTAAENTSLIPAGLTASTYSTANFNTIATKVAAVNGVRRSDLVAFGELAAISNILPTDGTGAAVVGLQYGLGEEWFRRGYLPNAAGVQIIEVDPVVVPGTQNSTIQTIGLGDNIFIAAKAGAGYAPMVGGYYEGSPIVLEMTPDITADFTIDVNAGAMFDIQPVFASKVGVITDVTGA